MSYRVPFRTKLLLALLLTGASAVMLMGWLGYSTARQSSEEAALDQLGKWVWIAIAMAIGGWLAWTGFTLG